MKALRPLCPSMLHQCPDLRPICDLTDDLYPDYCCKLTFLPNRDHESDWATNDAISKVYVQLVSFTASIGSLQHKW